MGFRLKQDILRAEQQDTERGLGEMGPGHGGEAWTWGRGRGRDLGLGRPRGTRVLGTK